MIIATAGHVDHGKTALIRALTGIETDRLPEERSRGMSIDLGFAYVATPGGRRLGFVDVPGHERFIRNMVSGVAGVDAAMLVVAADDGAMPQTLEHVRIARWLGIFVCAGVLTKIDQADAPRIAEGAAQIRDLVGPEIPLFQVSIRTGEGLDALRDYLHGLADAFRARDPSGRCRVAIDRAFRREGHGVVVTGTVYSGEIRLHDELVLTPESTPVRVRGLQSAGRDVPRLQAGERCAVNLAGAELSSACIERGDWLLDRCSHEPTEAIDVRLEWRADDGKLPRRGAKVQVHVGAAVADAVLRKMSERGELPSDATFALEKPLFVTRGDRLIVRDRNGTRTVAGGGVTDPFAVLGRRQSARASLRDVRQDASAEDALVQITCSEAPADLLRFEVAFNLTEGEAEAVYRQANVCVLKTEQGRVAIGRESEARHRAAIEAAVSLRHAREPQRTGLPIASLPGAVEGGLPDYALFSLARRMVESGELEIEGTFLRAPGFRAGLSEEDVALWRGLQPLLDDPARSPWRQKDLAEALAIEEGRLETTLRHFAAEGKVLRLADRVFASLDVVRRLAVIAGEVARERGGFKAAEFRDASGLNRRAAIHVLEYFDGVRLTRRKGEERRMLRPVMDVFGEGGTDGG